MRNKRQRQSDLVAPLCLYDILLVKMNHSSHLSGPIVFTGSSIIALWENLPQFFPEVELLNTAISGSQTDEIYVHLDALVVSQSPSLVCYYCGSNDINYAVAVQVIVENVIKTYQAIRDKLGQTTFVFLSIIKAPQKMNRWGVVDEVNMQINQLAHTYPGFAYIDINPFSSQKTVSRGCNFMWLTNCI